jgi:uncharacterized protein with von Willebrand factor type A (vWA) domain
MNTYRYSEWDGTQNALGFDKNKLMNELAQGMIRDGDLSYLLWKMQRQDTVSGEARLTGLQKLMQRLLEEKQKQQGKYDLSALMAELGNRMDDIIRQEQTALQKKLDEAKRNAEQDSDTGKNLLQKIEEMTSANLKKLKDLPSDISAKIKELQKYDFIDGSAGQQFQDLMASALDALQPEGTLEGAYPYINKETITFSEALKLMETLQQMDRLEGQIEDARYISKPEIVDRQAVRELLGEQAIHDLDTPGVSEVLEAANYIRRKEGGFELTPLGMRKIGEKALSDIYSQLQKDKFGGHKIGDKGSFGKRSEETKRFEFGDNFDIELKQTIMNALLRERQSLPVKLKVDDFEVYKSEQSARSSTVLMLDLSLSMSVHDNFYAAKHVAIALHPSPPARF